MKISSIILILLAIGLVITGCSNTPQITNTDIGNTPNITEELTMGESVTDPDIGTLDDINVSEEIPE
ncbi:MAG: hypothetical protein ACP5N1_07015 [Candidatus Woesearchaeota archaeon]